MYDIPRMAYQNLKDQPIDVQLQVVYNRVKHFPEEQFDGFVNLVALRNLVPDAIFEIERLRAQLTIANADIARLKALIPSDSDKVGQSDGQKPQFVKPLKF